MNTNIIMSYVFMKMRIVTYSSYKNRKEYTYENNPFLKRLVENVLGESANMIKEYYEGDDFIVYHCAHEETLPSLFKFGFEAYFTARGVGNAYGRGVYTTFSLRSTVNNAKRGEYGRAILKCKIRSFKNFLISKTFCLLLTNEIAK